MANTGDTVHRLIGHYEPRPTTNRHHSSGSTTTTTTASSAAVTTNALLASRGTVAGIPKLDFLCTVMEIDEHFKMTSKGTIGWKAITDSSKLAAVLADAAVTIGLSSAATTTTMDSTMRENRDDVNRPNRDNGPPNERQKALNACCAVPTSSKPSGPLGRPLPRPPMLPSNLYTVATTNNATAHDKKRKLDEADPSSNAARINTFHCKGKVYLPSGKSLDVVSTTMLTNKNSNSNDSNKRRSAAVFPRCTEWRMDPLSPPPFTLPKRPVVLPH